MSEQRKSFIASIAQSCVDATAGTNLFPSVMISQACLEGRDGQSTLAKKHHNHFGIKKSSGWLGAFVLMKTKEFMSGKWISVNAPFRVYSSLLEGFKDRVSFLQRNSRYAKAGVFTAATPEAQVKALVKAGYATDDKYYTLVTGLITGYNLKQYDALKKKALLHNTLARDAYTYFKLVFQW